MVIVFVTVLFVCFLFSNIFFSSENNYTITTSYGDRFNVVYHTFKGESRVYSPDNKLNWYYGGYIKEDDFIGVTHTDSLTLYKLKGSIIFDDGNGFEEFSEKNIDEKPEVVQIVKEILLSDYYIFTCNMHLFLKSTTYKQEAEQIIDCIKQEKLDKLSQYGLTEDVINDGYTLDLLKHDANYL